MTAALGGEAFAALSVAEGAFVAILGPPPAGRLKHLPTIRELLWCLARLDRYGNFGRGESGAGQSVLEGRLEMVAREGDARPRHVGYFLPALHAEARRWKHTWAPRIKADRVARGVRREPKCFLCGVNHLAGETPAHHLPPPAGHPPVPTHSRRRGKTRQPRGGAS